jgi:CubicO group peptidase (beta-lactamase class C family)
MKKAEKRILAVLLASSVLLGTACRKKARHYTADNVTLGEDRTFRNNDPRCEELCKTLKIDQYHTTNCRGCYLVANDEDILYLYCEDAKEIDGVTSVNAYTTYDVGSTSKTITATAVMQLIEKGKLSMDDTIDKFFPGYHNGSKITVYNLLHMQSGIPDYLNEPNVFWGFSSDDEWDRKEDFFKGRITDEEFLAALDTTELHFTPGSRMSYSNTNYQLLAMIVEIVSEMPFCDYLQKNIFDPCGMKHTTSMVSGNETAVPTAFQTMYEAGLVDETGRSMQGIRDRGDGGIHTCVADLLAFDRALFGGKLVSEESLRKMQEFDHGYGCGLMPNGTNGCEHGGSAFTYNAENKITTLDDGKDHIYIIILEHH